MQLHSGKIYMKEDDSMIQKKDGIFKTYGVYEDKDNVFTRSGGAFNPTEHLATPKVDIEFSMSTRPRKTMLKSCNSWLNIKYTISATEDLNIKSYIYYVDDQLAFTFLCKGRTELTLAMQFFKLISQCRSKSDLVNLVTKYQSLLTFI